MGQGSIRKSFKLQEEWSDDAAIAINDFLDEVVARQTAKAVGSYTGTGREQTVKFQDLLEAPVALVLQKSDGSATAFVLVTTATNVVRWSKREFVLAAGSSMNLAGQRYQYLALT